MKTWFVSSLWLFAAGSAFGARAREGLACLEVGDLRCAIEVRDEVVASGDVSEVSRVLQLRTLFREGRFKESVAVLEQLEKAGAESAQRETNPYRGSVLASRGLVEAQGEGVRVRYANGIEAILKDEALEVMERSRTTYDALFGGGPDHEVLLDIFPTAQRFIQASGLPPEAVRKTGVVALSKWSRLLISSPRSMARGYGWKDTVAHEYIHLVVAWRSADRTPVWLQEGLAKLLESRWRTGRDSALTVHQQSLLRTALESDSFVPFEKFKYSMAYLDSGDEAALAFAQVATLVQHVLERGGDDVLSRVMDRIRDGESAEPVMASVAGYPDFDALMLGWKNWLRTRALSDSSVASLPVVLDADADEFKSDPLLAMDASKMRAARLGELLLERKRPLAALIEFRKAADGEGPASPLLMAREAQCLADLDRVDEALSVSAEAIKLYPEFTPLLKTRAKLLDQVGRPADAVKHWATAHDLNPFDASVQTALIADYLALGKSADADRHRRILSILQTGGAAAVSR
jgi:tetratricopeptide (TPR) repeat protein